MADRRETQPQRANGKQAKKRGVKRAEKAEDAAARDPSALLSFDEERLVFSDVPEVVWWSGEVDGCWEDFRGEIALVLLGLFVCWWLVGGVVG